MAEASKGSISALGSIAAHERKLMARVAEAEQKAREIIEAARAEAAELRETSEKTRERAVAELRREAAAARDGERLQILRESEDALQRMRAEAKVHVPALVREVLALVVPGVREGGAA